jgi:hypothetical protein
VFVWLMRFSSFPPFSLTGQAKINKPHVHGSASNNINASTLFFKKTDLLVIKMPNKISFCCKSLSKIFFVIFITALKLAFIHTPHPIFIPHFPLSRMFFAS